LNFYSWWPFTETSCGLPTDGVTCHVNPKASYRSC